jgi:hypothetical protein
MRRLLVGSVAVLSLLAPVAARAQFFLGARGAWAVPSGEIQEGAPIKDAITGMVQGQIDAGAKVFGPVAVGVYASYGWTNTRDSGCPAGFDCSGRNLRLGIQVNLQAPLGALSVWGGPFGGWEQQQLDRKGGGVSSELKLRGVEGGLQVGLDVPMRFLKVGPYISASIARYATAVGGPAGGGIAEKATHGWLTFGVRAAVGL